MKTVADLKTEIAQTQATMQTARSTLKAERTKLNGLRADLKKVREQNKTEKLASKILAASVREQKRKAKIAALEARIKELQTPKTGIAAKKAAKKPGKVTVIKPSATV